MYRFAQEQVEKWITARRRKPLIVRGARQVGKTWLVEHAAASKFESMVKIDLEKRRDLHIHFSTNLDPEIIVQHLELDSGRRIVPGRTLPGRHRTLLRYLRASARAATDLHAALLRRIHRRSSPRCGVAPYPTTV